MVNQFKVPRSDFFIKIRAYFQTHVNYIRKENYTGYYPYDGLNSSILKHTPLSKISIIRLCWIQFFKRSPLNIRNIFLVPRSFNSKAGALFLLGNMKMFKLTKDERYKEDCLKLYDMLRKVVIPRKRGVAWGYNFDWHAKAFFVPKGTPNIVTTVYVGHALLEFLQVFNTEEVRKLVIDIRDFILTEMIMWERETTLCFSYIPQEKAEVHNANLLAAAFLSRVCLLEKDLQIENIISKAVNFSIHDIQDDGYWPYGKMPHHRWMDNFHTAFNLEALLDIIDNLQTNEFDGIIRNVFRYYVNNMFLPDGTPKYYHNKLYPIDIHTIAESIIFLSKCVRDESGIFTKDDKKNAQCLVESVVQLSIQEFWNKKGYFYYQKNKYYMNKIPYMRWSQAWMFFALCSYQEMVGSLK